MSPASGIFQPSIVGHHTNIANRIKQSSGCTLCVSSRLFPYLGRLCPFDYAPFPQSFIQRCRALFRSSWEASLHTVRADPVSCQADIATIFFWHTMNSICLQGR